MLECVCFISHLLYLVLFLLLDLEAINSENCIPDSIEKWRKNFWLFILETTLVMKFKPLSHGVANVDMDYVILTAYCIDRLNRVGKLCDSRHWRQYFLEMLPYSCQISVTAGCSASWGDAYSINLIVWGIPLLYNWNTVIHIRSDYIIRKMIHV